MIHRSSAAEKAKGKILFVHGMCHGAWCWDQGFMQFFTKYGYDCYAIDLPGHERAGRNKSVNQYGIEDYIEAVKSCIKQLGEDSIIVAHSMGGFITQKFLEKNRCKAAILLGSVPPSGLLKPTLRYLKAHPDAIRDFFKMDIYLPFVKYADDLYSSEKRPQDFVAYQGLMRSESFKAVLNMIFSSVKGTNQAIPKLVIGADQDQVITLNKVHNTANKQGVKAHIFSGFGHNMMLEDGFEEIADLMLNWMETLG